MVEEMTVTPTIVNQEQHAIGSAFVHKFVKTGERFRIAFNFTPFEIDLLEYGINRSGTRNVDKSLTIGASQDLNNAGVLAEKYYFATGCQFDNVRIAGSTDRIFLSTELVALDWLPPSLTSGLAGTPTWEPLTQTGFTHLSGGLTPISWNAASQRVRDYDITIANAVDETQLMGNPNLDVAQPTTQRTSGTIQIPYSDNTLITDALNGVPRTLKIQIGPSVFLNLLDTLLEEITWSINQTSTTIMQMPFRIKSAIASISTT
jgi:hypothetical protein